MSYSPNLSGAGLAMALLTGVQSTTNAAPSASSTNAPWLTLPPTTTDGISFSAPVLMRGFIASTTVCRTRVGDSNDAANYKEQAGYCVYPYLSATADLYEEVSDDEVVFFRSGASSTIKPVVFDEWTSASFPGMTFGGSYTRYAAFRMG